MAWSGRRAMLLTTTLLLAAALSESCDPGDLVQGCRVEGPNYCVCGLGCRTSFSYATREQCLTASRGERGDPCSSQPCRHHSYCTQIIADPGYQCFCDGTGYYGRHCELSE
ncbi:protein crumbs [Hyalella azteca]|uniref:Protein crumbs n=1 Tax=Hyalella azteca TaxID=294128 RepID=A0A8B7PI33_HYAAZ|nr:protein crumbs [Hyalella azteca]